MLTPRTSTRTVATTEWTITGRDVLRALVSAGSLPVTLLGNRSVTMTVRVPGGGDYSGCQLDLLEDAAIEVSATMESFS